MKDRKSSSSDYSKIKSKLFLQMLAMLLGSLILVLLLYFISVGHIGEFLVNILAGFLNIGHESAITLYTNIIRNNRFLIVSLAVIIMFLTMFTFSLSWFGKYFDKINKGIDTLVDGKNEAIKMSPDMQFMEKKLNTVRKTLEQRELDAKLSEQKKNDLVMYLAHDIKTPLTSVIGYLSLLDEAPDMPLEQKTKYIHITLDKAYRLEQLINEFFEITRYNTQKITLQKKNIDLYYMLMQMTDEAYPQLSAHGQQTLIHVPEDIMIYGDANQLARVFDNILKNAIAYGENNSNINITAQTQNNMLIIEFTNKGTISQEKMASIFDKFYRLDDARSSNTGGAGLGLAIAKEIITLHNGSIYAKSKDDYTIFTVELPIAPTTLSSDVQRRSNG